jgi:hypothetical protein
MTHDEDLDQREDAAEPEQELPQDITEGASGVVGFVGGLVLGALIGAGIALLVAPERGKSLRGRLARRIRAASDDVRGNFEDLKDSARRRLARRRRRLRREFGPVMD